MPRNPLKERGHLFIGLLEKIDKKLVKNFGMIRESGKWSCLIMHSGISAGIDRLPEQAMRKLLDNISDKTIK
jgi:hypothetical protein